MLITVASYSFFVFSAALAYWLWIRPLLRARPQFTDFYNASDSFWQAVWLKLSTIKTKLASKLLMIASVLVGLHDFLLPIVTGIDWTPITQAVPPWAWPIISLAIGWLFLWLREVTERTQRIEMQAVVEGASPAEAKVVSGVMPTIEIARAEAAKDQEPIVAGEK